MSTPFQLIEIPAGDRNNIYENQAINMAAAHNIVIQGFNAILLHAPNIPEQKIQPFLIFCLTVLEHINHHHHFEETYFFPEIEKRLGEGTFSVNVRQHEEFIPQLEALEGHLKAIQEGKEKYDGQQIVNRIHEFGDSLIGHLRDEIKTLDANRFANAFTEKELKGIESELVKRELAVSDFYKALPLVLVCADPASPWFPPIPTPVKWAGRWWYSRKYKESWQFGPLDLYGNPRS